MKNGYIDTLRATPGSSLVSFLTFVVVVCLLVGCSTPGALDEAVGVAEGENAILCAEIEARSPLGNVRTRYRRLEFPSTMTTPPTEEQVDAACPEL